MRLIKNLLKRTVLIMILISTLITFLATPASYAELSLEDDEFYYAGTTEGSYVPTFNIFSWLINNIGDIADWLLGIITMGFRMVFVGWTALLEKALTWALESTTGVSADGSLVESSTDMTGLTDSSNNITVEAIVYNKVAGLNIDFFDLDFDRGTTGTGKRLVCQDCNKYVAEYEDEEQSGCIPNTEAEAIKADAENIKKQINSGKYDFGQHCACECNGCDSCEKYVKQLVAEKPIVLKIRELVATWYSIIRFLAMAAMLVILIAIGIKMALSTIASDKAVYKRMLVDWVVGVIILFAIHYFMIFCIHMNGVVVKTIEDSAQSINQVQMQQLFGTEEGISNSELEIKVYEEVRTRAYDARLINGMMGMIMYMTLVFFAFKYTLIYLKRYLTILVLTLMGPCVGVAYALQKALSGKSSALSTWMKEYIMNIIIQIVHALLYAIFISQAMIISLQSVAGMIVALILMNYTSKADELFKKIFNFGGGDSLLGHTEGAMDSTMQGLQTAKGLATGAKPLAKAITNTPYGKAVKGVGKLALAGVASAGAGISKTIDKIAGEPEDNDSDQSQTSDSGEEENTDQENGGTGPSNGNAVPVATTRREQKQQRKTDDAALKQEGGDVLRANLDAATARLKKAKANGNENEIKAAQQEQLEAIHKYNRFQQITMPTTADVAKGKVKRIIDMENVFESTAGKGAIKVGWAALFGTTSFNTKTMKFENKGDKGVFNMYKKFTPTNLFGLTDADKKQMKAISGDMGKALLGMGGLFFGMASVVAQPKVGMALMASGYAGTKKVFGKNPKVSGKKGKYTFSKFGSHSLNTIKNSALVRAKQEHDAIVAQGIETNYPSLAENLKNGKASAITIGELGGELGPLFATQNSPYSQVATSAMIEKYGGKRTRFMKNTALGGKMDEFAKHYSKQQRKQIGQFIEEATDMEKTAIEARIEFRKEIFESGSLTESQKEKLKEVIDEDNDKLKDIKAILEEQGYGIDAEGELVKVDSAESKDNDIYKTILLAAERDLEEARKTGTRVDEKTIAKKYDVDADDMVTTIGSKKITQTDVDLVNKTIDDILTKMSNGKEFNIDSEHSEDEIIRLLSKELAKSKLLSNGQTVEDLFKGGRKGLRAQLNKKAAKRNTAVKAARKKLEEVFTPEGADAMAGLISEVTDENTSRGRDSTEVMVSDVISRIEKNKDGSLNVKASDGTVRIPTTDGSSTATGTDGSKTVGGKMPLDNAQLETLQQFMQVTRAVKPPAKGEKVDSTEAQKIISKSKEQRESKLQQAMFALMGEEESIQAVATETGKEKPSTQDVLAQLSQRDSDYVTATVKDLLELKELNVETAKLNVDKVKGSKAYTNSRKAESTARIDLAVLDRQIIIENTNLDANKNNMSQEQINKTLKTIESLKDSRAKKVEKLQAAENKTSMTGPVINLSQYVKDDLTSPVKNETSTIEAKSTKTRNKKRK